MERQQQPTRNQKEYPPLTPSLEPRWRGNKQPPKAAVLPVVAMKGTQSDPHFPKMHPQIKKFNAYLQSLNAITTDVSKFPKYASPDKLNWLAATEPQKVREYLEHLEKRSAIGIDGRLTKLQCVSKVLSCITQELFPNDKKLFYRCQQVGERYAKWRRVMQRERNLKSKMWLERASNEARPLSQMMALVQHQPAPLG